MPKLIALTTEKTYKCVDSTLKLRHFIQEFISCTVQQKVYDPARCSAGFKQNKTKCSPFLT